MNLVADSYGQRPDADADVTRLLRRIEHDAEIEPYGLEGVLEVFAAERRAIDAWLERKQVSRIGRRRVWHAIAGWLVG